ncbi:MAG: hypothetical protein HY315_02640 [Acidobacteria bacterium]|nr:hypothetical protein [Acidobacteriota bacterium]
MRSVVHRERNKIYYRALHVPIWIWVFFILPGHLTYALFLHGPDRRHWIWLAVVVAICVWRGFCGRLPGVELRPYITHFGVRQANLPYRVACYTAAWIDLLVPFTLNLIGLVVAATTGVWRIGQLYAGLYYPLACAVVLGTWLGWTPRARRWTDTEGSDWAWFYVALWSIVPSELAGWIMWRLGSRLGLAGAALAGARLAAFLVVAAFFFLLGFLEKLGRTKRYYAELEAGAGRRRLSDSQG